MVFVGLEKSKHENALDIHLFDPNRDFRLLSYIFGRMGLFKIDLALSKALKAQIASRGYFFQSREH